MIFETLRAFFDAIAKGFSCAETKTLKQCETEVLKSKKRAERRSGKQEDLLLDMLQLLEKYKKVMTKTDRIKVNVYTKRIKGVN